MQFSLVVATLLCVTMRMTSVQASGPVVNCCVQRSKTQVPINRIVNYTIQNEGSCPIKAIVFLTKAGKRICSDPDSEWAKCAKNKVDKEMQALLEKGQDGEGSPNGTLTPAVPATPTHSPQRNRRNEKKAQAQNKRSRKAKKGRKQRRRGRKCI